MKAGRLLVLSISTMDSLKGYDKIQEVSRYTLDGMFSKVYFTMVNIHAGKDSVHTLNNRVIIREYGLKKGHGFAFGKLAKLANFFLVMKNLRRLIKEEGIGLIFAEDDSLNGLTAFLLNLSTGTPYIVMVNYNYDLLYLHHKKLAIPFMFFRGLESFVRSTVIKRALGIIASNEDHLQYALRYGANPKKSFKLTVSVHPTHYEPLSSRGDMRGHFPIEGKKAVLWYGRLAREKYIDSVILAMREVINSIPESRLIIVGDGPLRKELESIVHRNNLSGQVRFLSVLPQLKLRDLLSSVDVIVGTQGMKGIIESALSGVPVIVYDYECNTEIIVDKNTGIVVPFKDEKRMAEQIKALLLNKELGKLYATRAREMIGERHSIEASKNNFKSIMLELMNH